MDFVLLSATPCLRSQWRNDTDISEVVKQAIFHQIEYLEELKIEEKLNEADLEAETTSLRYNSDDVFGKLRQSLNVWKTV